MPTTYRSKFDFYVDNNRSYLQLHALRAPVGRYREDLTADDCDAMTQDAVRDFEIIYDIEIFQLGRSGRHICVEDTPQNRRRYKTLQRKALDAAKDLWADMRLETEGL